MWSLLHLCTNKDRGKKQVAHKAGYDNLCADCDTPLFLLEFRHIFERKPSQTIQGMNTTDTHNARIAKMIFASVYPMYVAKVEKKGRTKEELHQVIEWLTVSMTRN